MMTTLEIKYNPTSLGYQYQADAGILKARTNPESHILHLGD
jgi:hypothetical protein